MIRRRNPRARWRWQYECANGDWSNSIQEAEQSFRDEASNRETYAAELAETSRLWRES